MRKDGKLVAIDPVKKTINPYPNYNQSINAPKQNIPANSQLYTESPDPKYAAFVQNNNIILHNREQNNFTPITSDGNDSLLNGKATFVYEEEITGANTMRWSHNGRFLAFMQFDESNVPVFSLYIPEGQHGHLEKQRFPKAGDPNPKVKIGIVDAFSKKLIWADFDSDADQYFGRLYFTPDNKLLVHWLNREQNILLVYEVEPENGKKKLLYEERQPTWLDINNAAGFDYINKGRNIIITSDKTGYRHYYFHKQDGTFINAITSGNYDVTYFLSVDESKQVFYFAARKENSARFDIYSVRLNGTGLRRISKGDFHYTNIFFSPDHKYFVANYSNTNTITRSAVFDINGNKLLDIGNEKGKEFDQYALPKKSFIRIKSTDGLFDLPVTITYPQPFDSTKQYPVLMTVYGGPEAGKVYDKWETSLPEIYWAQQGVIQVIADNRASGHFGKKGIDLSHRQMGINEIEDFMAVGKWLKQQPWVHPNKLCITGFSYGGYMTCMALTYGADVFDYGVAYYGTSDWRLYDTQYTERYMDSPSENPEGYKKTAVKTWLHKYKGMLRIIHGNSDNNVHPQHSLEIVDSLQELGKHFEFILYPGVRHGFRGNKWLHSKQELAIFINKYLLTP
ncbi:S9 family peptidase [Pseudobacter ginsenosidimutans]|nr:DPP IV N-terminal domain-containing protein [Pseudobacter ginsenosidimutans]